MGMAISFRRKRLKVLEFYTKNLLRTTEDIKWRTALLLGKDSLNIKGEILNGFRLLF